MNDNNVTLLKDLLRSQGHQVTRARIQTFQLLSGQEPITMNQLLTKAGTSVDRVSVYRNIALFEKLGIVHRIYVGWKYKIELSDAFTNHHHHLSCSKCGAIIDITDEQHIDEFIAKVSSQYGFNARRHQFEIEGYCARCAAT